MTAVNALPNKKENYVPREKALECEVETLEKSVDKNDQTFTRVYVMGETKFGQLGFMLGHADSSVIKMPKLCNYNILVKQIACGEAHTHILS